jgi:hypothetical protein
MKHLMLGAVLACLSAAPQDPVKLQIRAKKGERYTLSVTESTEGKVRIAGQELPFKEKEVLKYEDEVLETEGAEPARVRRKVLEWSKARQEEADAEPQKQSRQLEGKTIVLKKNGEKTDVEGAEGVPAAELREHQLRVDAYLSNLPKEAVKVGHEWNLDEKRLLEEFNEGADEGVTEVKSARGAARFEKVEDHKGVRCALIAVEVSGEGQIKEQMDAKIGFKMTVRIHLALESGRVLTMKGGGSGDLKGELDAGGEKQVLSGSFTFALDGEVRYPE